MAIIRPSVNQTNNSNRANLKFKMHLIQILKHTFGQFYTSVRLLNVGIWEYWNVWNDGILELKNLKPELLKKTNFSKKHEK